MGLSHPVPQIVALSTKEWNDTKIQAKVPVNISGVMDHQVKFQVPSDKGIGGVAWEVPFYAGQAITQLKKDDPAVKGVQCSTAGDRNYWNELNLSTGGSCLQQGSPGI